jgi:aminoglycoside 6'-N-acetyltransferase I
VSAAGLWPDETSEQHRRYAASLLNRTEDAVLYLAREEGGDVVAFAEATLRRDYVNGCSTSPVGFLEGVYVEPSYRDRGLARVLCEALADWAADLELHRVRFGCPVAKRAGSKSARSPRL